MAVDAAFLHALSDMIMSIGVVIAASIIELATYKYGYKLDDNGEKLNDCKDDTCYAPWSGEEVECSPCYLASEEAAKFFIADPICTFIFSILVCVSVAPIVNKCVNVLMEGSPPGFDIDGLIQAIKDLAGEGDEIEIHDFHLWSISQGKMALSAHLKTKEPNRVLKETIALCQNKFNIDHCTI